MKWTFFREEAESGDCETRDSYSDSYSDESECDKLWRWDGTSSEEGGYEQDCLWHLNDRLGHLYCQYFERSNPYGRVPLMDKVDYLTFFYVVNLLPWLEVHKCLCSAFGFLKLHQTNQVVWF